MALGAAHDVLSRYIFVSAFCQMGKGESYRIALSRLHCYLESGTVGTLCVAKVLFVAILKHVTWCKECLLLQVTTDRNP